MCEDKPDRPVVLLLPRGLLNNLDAVVTLVKDLLTDLRRDGKVKVTAKVTAEIEIELPEP